MQLTYVALQPLGGGPGNTRRVAVAAKTCQQFSADFPPGSTRTHERGPRPRTSTLCRKKQQFRCGFCLFGSSVCPAHGTPIQTAASHLVARRFSLFYINAIPLLRCVATWVSSLMNVRIPEPEGGREECRFRSGEEESVETNERYL